MSTLFDKMPFPQQVEAMSVICNIQGLHEMVYGTRPAYEELADLSLEELNNKQEELIPLYNQIVRSAAL